MALAWRTIAPPRTPTPLAHPGSPSGMLWREGIYTTYRTDCLDERGVWACVKKNCFLGYDGIWLWGSASKPWRCGQAALHARGLTAARTKVCTACRVQHQRTKYSSRPCPQQYLQLDLAPRHYIRDHRAHVSSLNSSPLINSSSSRNAISTITAGIADIATTGTAISASYGGDGGGGAGGGGAGGGGGGGAG